MMRVKNHHMPATMRVEIALQTVRIIYAPATAHALC